MIGKTLQEILNEKKINVNELANMINISNQTLYSIIKRDNMKIDFDVLLKICAALNVSVERFYSDYTSGSSSNISLSSHEKKLITAYRNKPEMQASIDKLLDINAVENKANDNKILFAAHGGDGVYEIPMPEDEKTREMIEETLRNINIQNIEDRFKRK